MVRKLQAIVIGTILTLSLTGCGFGSELPAEELEEIVNVIEMGMESEKQSMSKLPSTKEELLTMPLSELKAMIEECIPNYREFFKIPDTMAELTDDDWENMREILSLHLFGSAVLDDVENEVEVDFTVEEENIYLNPTPEFVRSLNDEQFVTYLYGLFEYIYPGEESPDYSKLTSEEIANLREQYAISVMGN